MKTKRNGLSITDAQWQRFEQALEGDNSEWISGDEVKQLMQKHLNIDAVEAEILIADMCDEAAPGDIAVDQTPKSFDPADWAEAIRAGGYFSGVLKDWVRVQVVPDDEINHPPRLDDEAL
jgi:hypothetical protein